MTRDEAFEKFWNTEIVSSVTGKVDVPMWGDIDRNDTAYIFMAGYNACKEALEQPAQDTETMAVAIALQEQIRQLKEQPAQKPLSDDEIDKILDNDDLWKVEGDEVYVRTTEFARAIEQAHGIGVKDE